MSAFDLTPRLAREAASNGRDTILFDRALPGFGLRIHPSGRKVWIVQARIDGRSRRIVVGRHGEMDLAEARRRARDMLARIRAGGNPADDIQREKKTPTFRAFAEEYLRRSEPHWKPSGRKTVRIYLNARILPAFGKMPLDAIGPEDVAAWFDAASKDKPGAANRAFEILRAMLFRAEEWGLRARDSNPCLGIAKNPRNNIARFLDMGELARLGRALDANEDRWPDTAAAIRLLALTGCRRSEVLDLRWRNVGKDALALEDSKTGPRAVPLGEAARALVADAARRPRPGRVPVPAPCRRRGNVPPRRVLARGLRGCRARQAAPARPAPHGGEPGRHGRREPAPGRQAARPPAVPDHRRLRPCRRCAPGRDGGEGRRRHRRGDGGHHLRPDVTRSRQEFVTEVAVSALLPRDGQSMPSPGQQGAALPSDG